MNILITGFEPFGNELKNPTQEVIDLLPKNIKGHIVKTLILPVVFDECFLPVVTELENKHYDIIVHLGLAAKRTAITPERLAINIKDARIIDNQGNKPCDEVIIENAPLAYHTTLPIRKIESILTRKHIPVAISNSAGLYVCNNLMYHTLHYLNTQNYQAKAGFIHVPYMREQVENNTDFSMPLYDILEAVIDSIKTML